MSRALTTALWPAAMTASARARPSPVEQPVMSHVAHCEWFLSVAGQYAPGLFAEESLATSIAQK
jgi:hypothetical protein